MPFFGTTPFAAPGLGVVASAIMLGFGLWWLGRTAGAARRQGEGFGDDAPVSLSQVAGDENLRERATMTGEFDPAEIVHGEIASTSPPMTLAALPLAVVIGVNLVMSLLVLPALDTSFLAEPRWGATSLSAVGGVWSVVTALACGIVAALAINRHRIPQLRATVDAGANASVLPVVSVASLVGFGAVVAAMPAFASVRDAVLGIGGGPLVSLAVATNVLAALTGSASGGLMIALDALGSTYMARAAEIGLDPGLLHRVAVIGSGTLDTLPHNGAIVTLLAICGSTHRESYRDIIFAGMVGPIISLVAIIVLGSLFGAF
jgi:H+/gluconate symporter-like permease